MLLARESRNNGKLYVINIVDSVVNADTLVDIYRIDEIVYEAEYRSTMEQIAERFESRKNDYLLAYCGNKLIGYLTYLPINETCKDKILNDDYFKARNLYPNVDFYSGVIFLSMGIPVSMFTVMFALARTIGWISQWNEMMGDEENRIGRPRQIYMGETRRDYVPVSQR